MDSDSTVESVATRRITRSSQLFHEKGMKEEEGEDEMEGSRKRPMKSYREYDTDHSSSSNSEEVQRKKRKTAEKRRVGRPAKEASSFKCKTVSSSRVDIRQPLSETSSSSSDCLVVQCIVDGCHAPTARSMMRSPPWDDIETALQWPLATTASPRQQTFLIQKILEQWKLTERQKDFTNGLLFWVCPQHFEKNADPLPLLNLPRTLTPDIAGLLIRNHLRFMYGLDEQPLPASAECRRIRLCMVIGCSTHSNSRHPSENRLIRLFPLPIARVLRKKWLKQFPPWATLPDFPLICELHFPHGGRHNGKPELPSTTERTSSSVSMKDSPPSSSSTSRIGKVIHTPSPPSLAAATEAAVLPEQPQLITIVRPTQRVDVVTRLGCAIPLCPKKRGMRNVFGRLLKFFPVPPNPERKVWERTIQVFTPGFLFKECEAGLPQFVCEVHFRAEDIEERAPFALRLVEGAVPSQRLANKIAELDRDVVSRPRRRWVTTLLPAQSCCEESAYLEAAIGSVGSKISGLYHAVASLCHAKGLPVVAPKPFSDAADDELVGANYSNNLQQVVSSMESTIGNTCNAIVDLEQPVNGNSNHVGAVVSSQPREDDEGNQLLRQLVGDALPGQVSGEIVDLDDDIYEDDEMGMERSPTVSSEQEAEEHSPEEMRSRDGWSGDESGELAEEEGCNEVSDDEIETSSPLLGIQDESALQEEDQGAERTREMSETAEIAETEAHQIPELDSTEISDAVCVEGLEEEADSDMESDQGTEPPSLLSIVIPEKRKSEEEPEEPCHTSCTPEAAPALAREEDMEDSRGESSTSPQEVVAPLLGSPLSVPTSRVRESEGQEGEVPVVDQEQQLQAAAPQLASATDVSDGSASEALDDEMHVLQSELCQNAGSEPHDLVDQINAHSHVCYSVEKSESDENGRRKEEEGSSSSHHRTSVDREEEREESGTEERRPREGEEEEDDKEPDEDVPPTLSPAESNGSDEPPPLLVPQVQDDK